MKKSRPLTLHHALILNRFLRENHFQVWQVVRSRWIVEIKKKMIVERKEDQETLSAPSLQDERSVERR